jgi:hypothetical protein
LDKVRARVGREAYRDNLTKMVQWGKQRGSSVAFILLGDNPNQTEQLRQGVKLLSDGNLEKAIQYLTWAKDDPDDVWFSALARLYLAEAYRKAGRNGEADKVLVLDKAIAGTTGGYPVVLDTEYHQIMREVAQEHGVVVIDAASELNKTPEVFWDFCHFDQQGHATVAKLVGAAMEEVIGQGKRQRP